MKKSLAKSKGFKFKSHYLTFLMVLPSKPDGMNLSGLELSKEPMKTGSTYRFGMVICSFISPEAVGYGMRSLGGAGPVRICGLTFGRTHPRVGVLLVISREHSPSGITPIAVTLNSDKLKAFL